MLKHVWSHACVTLQLQHLGQGEGWATDSPLGLQPGVRLEVDPGLVGRKPTLWARS
jgi:hypothetical protein